MADLHNLSDNIEGELKQAAQQIRSQHLRDLVHEPDRDALCLQFEDNNHGAECQSSVDATFHDLIMV